MISKDYKKHNDLARPSYGYFGRNEWAITGTDCNSIKLLADAVIASLSSIYKCAYIDSQHIHSEDIPVLPGHLAKGASIEYVDHIIYHQVNYANSFNSFQRRQVFNEMDLILVNGNHHQAKAQVIVIDEVKRSSLEKKLSQLTNVQLILLADNSDELFDFIRDNIQSIKTLPVYRLNETGKIIDFFMEKMSIAGTKLNGLVLAGGKSERMGSDKGLIKWHNKEQRYYMADMLKGYCSEVFISCRADQQKEIDSHYNIIADSFTGLGPYGALLAAFREQPDAAWLVVACDLPFIQKDTLNYLVRNRNCSTLATAFESPEDGSPEPLITIWEPKSYPVLLSFLAQGYNCPRKVLKNSDINLLKAPKPEALFNVNTREEYNAVSEKFQHKAIS